MVHYRQALVRMRQGESDRQIHTTGLMGRRRLGTLRKLALALKGSGFAAAYSGSGVISTDVPADPIGV